MLSRVRLVTFSRLHSTCAAVLAAAFVSAASPLHAQTVVAAERGAPALGSLIASLGTSARVLVIAAHPDDEDTNLIAWLSRGRHVETAYLSLTRGDGGQNLIGNELGEALGIIRTQEMLAARRIDGGRQFFTRAYDFGFSKSAEETLEHWPRDTVLGDVVKVVRTFRPHVIVAFFSGTPRDGHGHHQVSGIFAREAYDLSADTARFPASTHGAPWLVPKFYRSARQAPDQATLRVNAGEYNPLLGRSYAEIAGESRTQHKSQGFGALQPKGVVWSHLLREDSRVNANQDAHAEQSVFDGIDTTWARLSRGTSSATARAALDSAASAFAEARAVYRAEAPEATVTPLARALRLLRAARDIGARAPATWAGGAMLTPIAVSARDASVSIDRSGGVPTGADRFETQRPAELWDALATSIARTERALVLASGVAVEAVAPRSVLPVRNPAKSNVDDSLPVTITVFNRGRNPVSLINASVPQVSASALRGVTAANAASTPTVIIPDSQMVVQRTAVALTQTQSWWRTRGRAGDWFVAPLFPEDELTQQQRSEVVARATLDIGGVAVQTTVPVVHRVLDPVKGQQEIPVVAIRGITIGLDNVVEYIRADVRLERELRVNLMSAYNTDAVVRVTLSLPPGLVADSVERVRTLTPGAAPTTVVFKLRGIVGPGRLQVGAFVYHEGTAETTGYYTIDYDHIPRQNMYTPSGMWLASVNAGVPANARVGYVPGVSDHGIEALRQLGIPVDRLEPDMLGVVNLSRYTAIVVGPRAYDAQQKLPENNKHLLAYANRGGTLVVQYGQYEMLAPGIMPYPIELSRPAARVTIENAPVRMLAPTSPLLTRPNRIGPDDFEAWVQERAVYMPTGADARYTPLLAMNDPDEPENRGGLLVANVGRGRYVYVTLSLFRQLPSGVPGAARILLNLIAPREVPASAPAGR